MDYLEKFNEIMEKSHDFALATDVNGEPHVRIMNFCYDKNYPGIVYISTNKNSVKVKEFAENPVVALATIPVNDSAHVRSVRASIRESERPIDELSDLFLAKFKELVPVWARLKKNIAIFEIVLKEAVVYPDVKNSGTITF